MHILCAPERDAADAHKDVVWINAAKDEAMMDKGWCPYTNEKGETRSPAE